MIIMERISIPMFTYQYGDIELSNIINHDCNYDDEKLPKMTLTEFINKIKNNEEVEAGTFVYITMHDLMRERSYNYTTLRYNHVPTNESLLLEFDPQMDNWCRAYLQIDGKSIWIGDEVDGDFNNMISTYGDINAFEFQSFQEWS